MKRPDVEIGDVVALLRLLQYVRDEARRLGLGETAEMVDLQTASCLEEAGTLGLHVTEELASADPNRSTTH